MAQIGGWNIDPVKTVRDTAGDIGAVAGDWASDPSGSWNRGVQNIQRQGWDTSSFTDPNTAQGRLFYGGVGTAATGLALAGGGGAVGGGLLARAALSGRLGSGLAARGLPLAARTQSASGLAGLAKGGASTVASQAAKHKVITPILGAGGAYAGYNALFNRGGGGITPEGAAPIGGAFGTGGEGRWQELGLPSFNEAKSTLDLSTLATDDDWLQAANEMFEAYGESGRQWIDGEYAKWQEFGTTDPMGQQAQPEIVTLPETGQQGYWTTDEMGRPRFQVLQEEQSWQEKQAQAEWMAAPQNWIEVAMQRGETPRAPEAVSRYTPGLEAGQELSPEALHQMQVMSPAQWAQMSPVEQAQIRGFLESGRGGYTPAGLQQQISRLAPPGGSGPMRLSY